MGIYLPHDGIGEGECQGQHDEVVVGEQFLESSDPSQKSKTAAYERNRQSSPYDGLYSLEHSNVIWLQE